MKPRWILPRFDKMFVGKEIMHILCHWHCYIAFHSGAQATCAINNVVLGTTLLLTRVLRVTSATKPPSSRLCSCNLPANSRRAGPGRELSRQGFIIAGSRVLLVQPVVCSRYWLSKFQEEEDGRDEVDHITGEPEAAAVNKDADATPITGCQREASNQASSSDPWKLQGPSLLGYCQEVEKEEPQHKVNQRRDIAHHYNDEAEEWYCNLKYMKYKRHEKTMIPSLQQCCRGTFHCPTLLATIWPKTRSSTFGMFRDVSRRLKLRKWGRNSLRKKQP